MRAPDWRGLYAITPDREDTAQLLTSVSAVLSGGCRWLQYRDKTSSLAERRQRAEILAALCRQQGARLIINDDLDLALAVDADGVHLGANDGDLACARAALGRGKILGASCYADFSAARKAAAAGADYVAFGAVYPSPTKPAASAAPFHLFTRCRDELNLPVCAIGGITIDNAGPLLAAGADLVAVISDLFSAPDITARAAAYQELFQPSTIIQESTP